MSKPKETAHRAVGEGTLVKRGRFYHARWMLNGKLYVKSTKCTTLREAEKRLAELVAPFKTKSELDALAVIKSRLEASDIPDESKDKPTQLKFIWDKYKSDIDVNEVAEGSESTYSSILSLFEEHALKHGVTYAHLVTKDIAEEYLSLLKKRVQTGTYNAHLKLLKLVFSVVMKHDNNIRANPFESFKLLKVKEDKQRRELTEEEFARLHKVVETQDLQSKIMYALGEYAGMRISDACLLKWSSVYFKERKIRYLPKKTKNTGVVAVVPIHKNLYSLLKQRLSEVEKGEEYVCSTLADRYGRGSIGYQVRKTFGKADIKMSDVTEKEGHKNWNSETGFHALRHSFASRCTREGIPIVQIQLMLGHTTPMMSMEYAHAREKDLYLPEFDENLTTVKIKKSTYEKIMSAVQDTETFEDCLDRILRTGMIDLEEIKRKEAERKAKEDKEVDDMIFEVFPDLRPKDWKPSEPAEDSWLNKNN